MEREGRQAKIEAGERKSDSEMGEERQGGEKE